MERNKNLINCKTCGGEIAKNAKSCPSCGAKNKKPFYKKWWVWAIVIFIGIGATGPGTEMTSDPEYSGDNTSQIETSAPPASETQETQVSDVPTEYKSALKKAEIYDDTMHMSKVGLYDQLVSEYGEKFSKEAAQYAIDNIDADWKYNALKKAESYQETMAMSPSAIYDQLISDYGEKFTNQEAQYAIDNLK
ncbi:Ltp family lipoprotein [Proteocatella sphenisci]|uniref:Ltp family lipoprotein n=1 Tax=Proteocatella sphenisci TaxID=181070 RepID=UPI0004AFDDF1|nr:Ltp family lipoprotein [Proteocatella sphenisci]